MDGVTDGAKLAFYTVPTGGSLTERMTVKSTGQVLVQTGGINFATAAMVTGTADSIVVDFAPDLTLTVGLIVEFVAEAANTGATELTVDDVVKNIYETSDISALEANDIRNTMYVSLRYDGTQWQQISQSGN